MSYIINNNAFDKARIEKRREYDKRYKDATVALMLQANYTLKTLIRSLTCDARTREQQQEFLMRKMFVLCRKEKISGIFRTLAYTADVLVHSYTGFIPFTKLKPSQIVLHDMDPGSLREYAETLFIICMLLPSERTPPYRLPCMVRECENAYRALDNQQKIFLEERLGIHRHLTRILYVVKKMLSEIGYIGYQY